MAPASCVCVREKARERERYRHDAEQKNFLLLLVALPPPLRPLPSNTRGDLHVMAYWARDLLYLASLSRNNIDSFKPSETATCSFSPRPPAPAATQVQPPRQFSCNFAILLEY